jgi:hypothetical protein
MPSNALANYAQVYLCQLQSSTSDHSKAQGHADRPQPGARVRPLHGCCVDVVDGVQRAHNQAACSEEACSQVATGISFCEQAGEYGCDEQGHVLERVTVAGLAALVGGEIFGAEALLCLFDQGCGLRVAVVVLRQVALGRDGDGASVGIHGQDIVERDREEGEVDGHDGCCLVPVRVWVSLPVGLLAREICLAQCRGREQTGQVLVARKTCDFMDLIFLQSQAQWRYDVVLARRDVPRLQSSSLPGDCAFRAIATS